MRVSIVFELIIISWFIVVRTVIYNYKRYQKEVTEQFKVFGWWLVDVQSIEGNVRRAECDVSPVAGDRTDITDVTPLRSIASRHTQHSLHGPLHPYLKLLHVNTLLEVSRVTQPLSQNLSPCCPECQPRTCPLVLEIPYNISLFQETCVTWETLMMHLVIERRGGTLLSRHWW